MGVFYRGYVRAFGSAAVAVMAVSRKLMDRKPSLQYLRDVAESYSLSLVPAETRRELRRALDDGDRDKAFHLLQEAQQEGWVHPLRGGLRSYTDADLKDMKASAITAGKTIAAGAAELEGAIPTHLDRVSLDDLTRGARSFLAKLDQKYTTLSEPVLRGRIRDWIAAAALKDLIRDGRLHKLGLTREQELIAAELRAQLLRAKAPEVEEKESALVGLIGLGSAQRLTGLRPKVEGLVARIKEPDSEVDSARGQNPELSGWTMAEKLGLTLKDIDDAQIAATLKRSFHDLGVGLRRIKDILRVASGSEKKIGSAILELARLNQFTPDQLQEAATNLGPILDRAREVAMVGKDTVKKLLLLSEVREVLTAIADAMLAEGDVLENVKAAARTEAVQASIDRVRNSRNVSDLVGGLEDRIDALDRQVDWLLGGG
jgi:hypothetical protein